MPARAPHDVAATPSVTLRLPDVTGIPAPAGDRRAPLRSRLHGFTSGRHPGPATRKEPPKMTNQTVLIGRLTRPAVLKYTGDKARATFTIAIDGMNDKTDFVPITAFGKLAENVAEYTDKGHLVSVEGRISSGKYTNDAGDTVYTLDILANRISFLAKPRTATTTPDSVDPETDESEAA